MTVVKSTLRRSVFLIGIAAIVIVGIMSVEPRNGQAQTINTDSLGCDWTANSHFYGAYIRSYTFADSTCANQAGVWMQYELGGSWYSPSAVWNSPLYYYSVYQSPSGATDNWSSHQICLAACHQVVNTWVP